MKIYMDLSERVRARRRLLEDVAAVIAAELNDLYARIRSVKSDLTGPAGAPSATAVEERVRAEARIRDIETLVAGLEEAAGRLQTLSDELGGLIKDLQKLPSAKMSEKSEEHTSELQSLMRTSYAVFCWQKKNKT